MRVPSHSRHPSVPGRLAAFTPLQINGLVVCCLSSHGLYQTAGGVVAAVADDPVGQWLDLSGNGKHLTQATASARPLLKFDELGGSPCLRFDGTNDALTQASNSLSATLTHFLICRKRSAPDASRRALWASSQSNASFYAQSTVHATSWAYAANQAAAQQVVGGTAAAWQILVERYNSLSSKETWQDGVALTAFDPNDASASAGAFSIGATSTLAFPSDVDVAALLRYTVPLTNAQINAIAAWLLTRYPTGLPAWSAI